MSTRLERKEVTMNDILKVAAIICRAKDHLMQIDTKHPIKFGVAVKKIDDKESFSITVGIHKDDNSPILDDIIGHTLRLSEIECEADSLNNQLQDMIVYYHNQR